MVHLVDKFALVAEIENLESTYKKCPTSNSYEERLKYGRLIGYKDALYKIDTIEVKEVDLEKEAEQFVQSEYFIYNKESPILLIAKHFFELGIKTQKGE